MKGMDETKGVMEKVMLLLTRWLYKKQRLKDVVKMPTARNANLYSESKLECFGI